MKQFAQSYTQNQTKKKIRRYSSTRIILFSGQEAKSGLKDLSEIFLNI